MPGNSRRTLMVTTPDLPSVPMAHKEFDDAGRIQPGPPHDRVVDVREESTGFTLPTRGRAGCLVERYGERREREP